VVQGGAAAPGPASEPAIPTGENFMVDAPSIPLGRARTGAPATPAASAEPPSAEVAGNFMVDAPSMPVGRRPAEPAPPKQPLISRSRAPADRPPDSATPPAPASDTLKVGSATLIVGSAESSASAEAASVVTPTQPPLRRPSRSPAAQPPPAAKPKSRVPVIAGVVAVLLIGGAGVGYFVQKKGPAPGAGAPAAERPKTESASTSPA